MMRIRTSSLLAAILLAPISSALADVPAIKTSPSNQVPACVTPGRMMAYLTSRNERLDPRFEKIAVEYMRHGEQLGLRWDYAFYQMLLETGYLSFKGNGGRRGDVSPSQNNFAGLGATGHGASGERFPDVATGVLAHLQHVLVYAGETVEDPVAERTRKVQEWGILKSMQRRARGPVTFRHLATKWAPGANYVAALESLAGRFHEGFCRLPDPHPELITEARGETPNRSVAKTAPASGRGSGAALAKRAIADGKAEGDERRQGLGGGGLAAGIAALAGADAPAAATPSYSILNASSGEGSGGAQTTAPEASPHFGKSVSRDDKPAPLAMASAAGALGTSPPREPQAAPKGAKCRVWTASYGGPKALIIRVRTDSGTDFTVLDVNEGAERREADAYISAYAKGGVIEAEFASQPQALEKAFELCPEG
jgi:hypothetical protein